MMFSVKLGYITYLLRGLSPQAIHTDRATAACRYTYLNICVDGLICNFNLLASIGHTNMFTFFVIPFYSQSVPVHSANCVKDVYSGM
jgi:hypothetical protein